MTQPRAPPSGAPKASQYSNMLKQRNMGGVSYAMLGVLQAALDEMVSTDSSAAAPEENSQPASAYASSLVTLLTCARASTCEVFSQIRNVTRILEDVLE